MRSIRVSAIRQEDQQGKHSPIVNHRSGTPEASAHALRESVKPGNLSSATLLHMQHTYGNSATQRTIADHTSARDCSCLACKTQIRQQVNRKAAPTIQAAVQRCAACGTQEEEATAQQVQRWPWDDDTETESGDGQTSEAEPTSSTEPTSSSESDSGSSNGGSSWWPFGGDSESDESESGDTEESGGSWTDFLPDFGNSDEPESDDGSSGEPDEEAGEVSYGLPSDSRTMPSVTDYGKASVFDAEGYCKWDNIESDANNEQIVTTKVAGGKIQATGTTVMSFTSTADYTLPSVPAAITSDCEREKYQKAIDTTLRAHEEKHKAAFLTYNGSVSAQVNVTAADETALLAAVSAKTLDPTTEARYAAAKKKSADVDPPGGFKFTPDLSGCDKK